MKKHTGLAKVKIRILGRALGRVFLRWQYLLLALFGTLLASGLILWSLNLNLIAYILFQSPLSLLEKLDFFFSVYRDLYTSYDSIQGTGTVIFSVLFGMNLALLVYVLRRHGFSKLPKKSGVGGTLFAVAGGGCVACGTSIIAPLFATSTAASIPFFRGLGALLTWIAAGLIAFSIYKLAGVCAYLQATKNS